MNPDENASVATEAANPKHCVMHLSEKFDLRNEFKRSLFADAFPDDGGVLMHMPSDMAANDLLEDDDPDAASNLPVSPEAPESRYDLLTDDDLCKLSPMQWRIKNVLPEHGVAALYGPSGSGKSFLVLNMLQSLASGREWFGRKVKQCSVTYIVLEGEAGLAGRVSAHRIQHGSISMNIRYIVQPFRLLDADDINELVEAIQAAGTGDVVVLDTLSRATPGSDENDSKAMGQIIAAAKLLQDFIGGLVLLIHHTGKDASKGMRGHSSLHAALDCAIEVRRHGDQREWLVAKSKDGEDGASHPFKLEVVSLGHDNDGDEITSCVVVPDESVRTIQKKMPTLGSNQVIAHNALREPLSKSVDVDKDGAPPGRPCISLDDALAIVAPLIPVAAKYQKERAKAAIAGLVGKDVVGTKGDWLWDNQPHEH
ncbi:AAA family ATPase [Polaromonas sp.]|uniref:AAA family ATPase n=1 Tax=Polaromonas sp. TaxID=1869339 RepID=UPI00248957B4|nr:AAA family ATPase [Polaromonas sp.]MDI1272342.1 AAA family ATPase [Polaromonas sp.]